MYNLDLDSQFRLHIFEHGIRVREDHASVHFTRHRHMIINTIDDDIDVDVRINTLTCRLCVLFTLLFLVVFAFLLFMFMLMFMFIM